MTIVGHLEAGLAYSQDMRLMVVHLSQYGLVLLDEVLYADKVATTVG